MKILHITSQYPGKTGSGTYLKAMITEGHKEGYTQGLLGAVQEGLDYSNPLLEYSQMVRFNTPDLPFPIMGMSDKMPYKSSIYKDMTLDQISRWEKVFAEKLRESLEEFKPDIILSNHLWLATSTAAQVVGDIPIFGICHGTDIRQLHRVAWLEDKVVDGIKKLNGIFALTLDQVATIERLYNVPIEMIHVSGGGYDEGIFHPVQNRKKTETPKLVYAGKLSYAKGLMPLLEAYEHLIQSRPADLTIVGSGEGEERDRIIKRGTELGVRFTGAVSQEKLADIFRDSDIFVLPSYYEGLPLVVMEALACGLMVVTTDIPGLKGYMGEKLASSGLVQFVKLPRMLDIDTPLQEDYNHFVFNLKKTLDKQINIHNDGYNSFAPYKSEIEKLSWQGVFKRIENQF